MSVEPDTPEDYRTITVHGAKMDVGPDATATEVIEAVRGKKVAAKTRGSRAWKGVTPANSGLVPEDAVETDDGDAWGEPETPEDYASSDLSDVGDGAVLRVHRAPLELQPVYEDSES